MPLSSRWTWAAQIRAAAILRTGELLDRRSAATPLAGGEEAIFASCARLLNGVAAELSEAHRTHLTAIGISSMGPVDPFRGLVVDPPNVTALRAPAKRVAIVPAALGKEVGLAGAWPLVAERHGDPVWRERRAGR
jgi:predicted NBD/HSP70 family sugar kinase